MIKPTDSLIIEQDTKFAPGVYYVPNGIIIDGDNVTLDGNGAVLIGKEPVLSAAKERNGMAVSVHNRKGVTIKNLRIQNFKYGVYGVNCRELTVQDCAITATAEVPANTIFLDIWLPGDRAYGSGILLSRCEDSTIQGNDLQHQMNGMLSYGCKRLAVRQNNASYCSGWGFHLYDTSDSLYEANCADYCCRWEPRGGRSGHMGADAAGFLIVFNSCRNIFRRNLARLGGDGFFLAGLTPDYEAVPCNDNLFEENDGSWSPNIAFEATFSAGNVFRNNYANHCNYGFWLGFSRDGLLEGNQMLDNARAGIAVENGVHFQVRGNHFQDSDHGILLWSKHIPDFLDAVPENTTSCDWRIENNTFIHNNKAVRIAANQDHGVRPYQVPEGEDAKTWRLPVDHILADNRFQDNRIAIEDQHTLRTVQERNRFTGSLESDHKIV